MAAGDIIAYIRGIAGTVFSLGFGADKVQLKNDSGVFEARNDDDTAYVIGRGASPVDDNDWITRLYGDTNYSGTSSASAMDVFPAPFDGYGVFDGQAGIGSQSVVYLRRYMPPGTYTQIEVAFVSGASGTRTLDMGVYGDTGGSTPQPTGALLASTGAIATTGANSTFFRQTLTSSLVVPSGGAFYWFAVIASSNSVSISTTRDQCPAVWQNRIIRFQSSTGSSTLPASVGTLDAISATVVPYAALVK